MKNTELVTLDQAVARLDNIAANAVATTEKPGSFAKTLAMAQAITDLRNELTPAVMQPIMALMNTGLGFKTDRDPNRKKKDGTYPTPYSVEQVREVVIEATLRGYYPCGNEINIIADNLYIALNGLDRRLHHYPGLTDLKEHYGSGKVMGEGVQIDCSATWKLNGVPDKIECCFNVKGTGYDLVIGKARRKLYARIMTQLTGTVTNDGEVEPDMVNMKPANAAPEFPAFSKTVQPVQPVQPESKPTLEAATAQSGTIRNELADFLAENKVDFTGFQRAMVDLNLMPNADSISEWNEVPIALCERLRTDTKLLSKIIKGYQVK